MLESFVSKGIYKRLAPRPPPSHRATDTLFNVHDEQDSEGYRTLSRGILERVDSDNSSAEGFSRVACNVDSVGIVSLKALAFCSSPVP